MSLPRHPWQKHRLWPGPRPLRVWASVPRFFLFFFLTRLPVLCFSGPAAALLEKTTRTLAHDMWNSALVTGGSCWRRRSRAAGGGCFSSRLHHARHFDQSPGQLDSIVLTSSTLTGSAWLSSDQVHQTGWRTEATKGAGKVPFLNVREDAYLMKKPPKASIGAGPCLTGSITTPADLACKAALGDMNMCLMQASHFSRLPVCSRSSRLPSTRQRG